MSVEKNGAAISRRGFLKGVAAASGTVAASAVVTQSANASAQGESVDKGSQEKKGYHVTPHILDYYQKARF